ENNRAEVGHHPRAHGQRNRALVAGLLAVHNHHRFAAEVLLVARHPELAHHRADAVLSGAVPGAAAVDPGAVVKDLSKRPTPDSVARLQQRHRAARLFQPQRRRQSRKTRTDHAVVDVGHDAFLWLPEGAEWPPRQLSRTSIVSGRLSPVWSGSGSRPAGRTLLRERDGALLRVIRDEYRPQDLDLLAPHLSGCPAAGLDDDALGGRDGERA